jgi:ferredoxin-NADP reductase
MNWRMYRLIRKVEETPNSTSIYLSAADDQPLQPFNGGQFLSFEIPGVGERAYVLSAFSAKPKTYRITVKHRSGDDDVPTSAAAYWRARAAQGDLVRVSGPTGSFHLPARLEDPLVLITAGAGEASLTAIAEELAVRARRHQVWFLHRTINSSTFALKNKLGSLRADLPNAKWWIWYSHPRPFDRKNKDYDHQGELNLLHVAHLLPRDGCDFYVCGPDGFVAFMVNQLQQLNVAVARIHVEGIGPEETQSTQPAEAEPSIHPLGPRQISFVRSGISAVWKPEDGSLLEFAERLGLAAAHSCRTGMCGTCAQRIVSGSVAPIGEIVAKPHPGFQLLCSNVPASDIEIDL